MNFQPNYQFVVGGDKLKEEHGRVVDINGAVTVKYVTNKHILMAIVW